MARGVNRQRSKRSGRRTRLSHFGKKQLAALVEEAIVDCYNEDEQRTGLLTMLQDHLALPFESQVFGVSVIVERVDLTEANEIVAVCRRGRERREIPILDLPLPSPRPQGAEWIDAYRHWLARG